MPAVETYPIRSISPEWIRAEEQMGSKAKNWVLLPEGTERWLFKFSRLNEGVPSGEHWAEKVAAEVAALLDLPHAKVELAMMNGRPGSLSRRFPELAEPGTEMVHGNDLLAGYVTGYDRTKMRQQSDHTLENIIAAVETVIPAGKEREQALTQLAGYLVLDALVLNTDRHHENWALLRTSYADGRTIHRVAPSFDHASSLGRNETEAKLNVWLSESWRPAWYAKRARGAIFLREEQKHGCNPLRLVDVAKRFSPQYVAPWLLRVDGLAEWQLEEVVAKLPSSMVSMPSRKFAVALLKHNLQYLKSLV